MDPTSSLEESVLRPLVERFYERVRADPLLAPVFASAIEDWNEHAARLVDFWSTVMLGSGRYKGNPVAIHLLHGDALTAERFGRWLELWRAASDDLLPPVAALAVQTKAMRIAESLQLAIRHRRPVPHDQSHQGAQ